MNDHPREHEELLAALLVGERRASDPAVERALEACPRCREEWSRLSDTAAALERAGSDRRAALAELAQAGPAPGEELVPALLQRLAAGEPRSRRRPAFLWLAAAALLVAGLFLARRLATREPPEPAWLGGESIELLAPLEEVPRERAFESFEWRYTGADAERFTLRVYELLEDGQRGRRILERGGLESTTWRPSAEERESMGERIAWEVEAFDSFQERLGSASARAWRSSR